MPSDFSGSIIAWSRSSQGSLLHEAVERLEEAQVVGDRAVEDDVDRVDETVAGGLAACDSG